jgi:hypothetical protein
MATRRVLLPLLVGLMISGCSWFTYSSDYSPQPKPGSALRLTVRNNRVTVVGGPPGNLEEKLAAVPEAARAARTFRRRSRVAAIGAFVGGGCVGVTAAIYVDGLRTDGPEYDVPLALTLTAYGCAAIAIGSMFLGNSARPYLYDAVNLYNDRIQTVEANRASSAARLVESLPSSMTRFKRKR